MKDLYFSTLHQFFSRLELNTNSNYNYLLEANSISYNKYYNLISYFHSFDYTKPIIVLATSIFNSPEIWFLKGQNTILHNILPNCNFYLIEWKYIEEESFTLDEYVLQIAEIIEKLAILHKKKVNLIGHCIGGTLSLAASIIKQQYLEELLLVTPPWDFSHFRQFAMWAKDYKVLDSLLNLKHIPHSFFQIFFFLFSQECILKKNTQFAKLKTQEHQKKFLAVEQWQMSGEHLPKGSFLQLLDDLILQNTAKNNLWLINNYTIKPKLLSSFVTLVFATHDKIVPLSSIESLIEELPNNQIYKIDSGHLGFLIGSKTVEFNQFVLNWTKNLN